REPHNELKMPDKPIRLSEMMSKLEANDSAAGVSAHDSADPAVIVLGSNVENPAGSVSSRRAFLARASTLSLALPGVAALAACSPGGSAAGDAAAAGGAGLSQSDLQNA